MKMAPIPDDEEQRQKAVDRLGVIDTLAEQRFDAITDAATRVFKVPISTLTIIDGGREWFKSCQGLDVTEGERAISFCGHALLEPRSLVILDTTKDFRFADNPMVTGSPYIRFYAGIPLFSPDRHRVGVFCLKDTKPHATFTADDEAALQCLAHWAEQELNHRSIVDDIQKCNDRDVRDFGALLGAHTQKIERIRELMAHPAPSMRDAEEELQEEKVAHLNRLVRDIKAQVALRC